MAYQSTILLYLSACLYFLATLAQTTQTTVVSVTATTTIHATATDYQNACNNFVGACVVYGADNGAYTTTIYAANPTSPQSTQTLTLTTTAQATSTVTDGSACNGFSGACVIYGTDGAAQYTATAYAATHSLGNSGGYIANSKGGGSDQGVIGAGSMVPAWTLLSSLGLVLAGGCVW